MGQNKKWTNQNEKILISTTRAAVALKQVANKNYANGAQTELNK